MFFKELVLYSEVSGNPLKALRPKVAGVDSHLPWTRYASRVGDGMWEVRLEARGQRTSGSCKGVLAPFHPKEETSESIRIIHISDSNNNNLNLIHPFFLGTQNRVKFVIKHSLSTPPFDFHPLDGVYRTQSACSLGFEPADPPNRTHRSSAVPREKLDCSPRHQKLRREIVLHLTWRSYRWWGRFPGTMATLKWLTGRETNFCSITTQPEWEELPGKQKGRRMGELKSQSPTLTLLGNHQHCLATSYHQISSAKEK